MRKRLRNGLIVGTLALAGALAGVGLWLAPRSVTVVAVQRRPLVEWIAMSGRVSAPARIELAAQLQGRVAEVAVKEGQEVKEGELLLRLDTAELDAALVQARAGLQQARARAQLIKQVQGPQARSGVDQARASLRQAEDELSRQRRLQHGGAGTDKQLADAETALSLARSRLESAEAAAAGLHGGSDALIAQAAVASAEGALSSAEARRAQAVLRAPAAGVILERKIEPGESATPGRVLLVLARKGSTYLTTEPDERNLARLAIGQPAIASADAFPQLRFDARVESIAPSVQSDKGAVEVKLSVPQAPPYLRPELTVSVQVKIAEKADALVLPAEAVNGLSSADPWVLVARGHRAERVSLELGLRGEQFVEVQAGLAEGDRVILPTQKPLRPGARIVVRPTKPGAVDK